MAHRLVSCESWDRGVPCLSGELIRGRSDLKGMAKISSSIMILRKGSASAWTKDLDENMNKWLSQYIDWLEHSSLALGEKVAAKFVFHRLTLDSQLTLSRSSNHGSFYFNQIAALKILVGNKNGALDSLGEYFDGIYKNQINADGEQPLEAERTKPYHYRAYNLAAMIVS